MPRAIRAHCDFQSVCKLLVKHITIFTVGIISLQLQLGKFRAALFKGISVACVLIILAQRALSLPCACINSGDGGGRLYKLNVLWLACRPEGACSYNTSKKMQS